MGGCALVRLRSKGPRTAAQQGAAADAAQFSSGAVRGSFGATPLGRGLASAAGAAQLSAQTSDGGEWAIEPA